MKRSCEACGTAVPEGTAGEACPACGAVLAEPPPDEADGRPSYTTHHRRRIDNEARIAAGGAGATTLFQPGLMGSRAVDEPAAGPDSDTRTLDGTPPPPALELDAEPYFLVLGAPPGHERIPLRTARTTFGRARADVDLGDRSVSSLHFQVDVMGGELFLRDLQSRNGTLLNGHPIRYSELLPGDEVRAGETVLVFRTSRDGLSDRVD